MDICVFCCALLLLQTSLHFLAELRVDIRLLDFLLPRVAIGLVKSVDVRNHGFD